MIAYNILFKTELQIHSTFKKRHKVGVRYFKRNFFEFIFWVLPSMRLKQNKKDKNLKTKIYLWYNSFFKY